MYKHSLLSLSKLPTALLSAAGKFHPVFMGRRNWGTKDHLILWVTQRNHPNINPGVSQSPLLLDPNCSNKWFILVEIPIKKKKKISPTMDSPMFGATRKLMCRRPRLGFHSACSSTILCQPFLSRLCLVLKGVEQKHKQTEPAVYLPPYGLLASTTGRRVHARHLPILRSWLLDPTHRFVGTHLCIQQAYSD